MAINEKLLHVIQAMDGKGTVFTETHPLYVCMNELLNDEQINLLTFMEMRVPITSEDLAQKSGLDIEITEKLLEEIRMIGLVEDIYKNGFKQWEFLVVIPGMAENAVLNKKQYEAHKQSIAKMFRTVSHMPAPIIPMIPVGGAGLAMHVIPVEKAIPAGTKTVNHEEISHWLKKYDYISVQDCQCRTIMKATNEWCGHSIKDRCFYVGDAARYIVSTGRGRRVYYDEAMKIMEEAEAEGLMHQISNIDGPDEIFTICNCCRCGCNSLKNSFYYQMPNVNRSNFIAKVDPEKCAACGECVEYCPANAVKLGQALCMKEKPEEPELIEVSAEEWGPKYWNPDFRKKRDYVEESGTAPCKTACPAHISVQAYIRLAAQGKYREALELIKKENPFPAICGRVCPHNCESECTRNSIDEGVSIDEIKKFIAEQELKDENRYLPRKIHNYNDLKVAVIGAGPSGLSCAYYLAVAGYSVTVFDKQWVIGGMMTLGIPEFRLEKDVINAEIEILKKLGVQFKLGIEVGSTVTIPSLREEGYRAFYIAIGAQNGRKLGIEGEEAECVISGVEFLRKTNLTIDTALSGDVIVIGGGNVAIDVSRTATRVGAETVSMYCLESEKEMPALEDELEEAKAENIAINNGWGPKRIIVENGKAVGVEFKKCTSVFKDGNFAPEYDENDTKIVRADHVIVSVGQSIDWGTLLEGTDVKLTARKTAAADELTCQTDDKDIFIGGDALTGPKFAINAIASGKQAAGYIAHYITPGQDMETGIWSREFKAIDLNNTVIGSYDDTKRQRPFSKDVDRKSFKDNRAVFTEEQLKKETNRCLKCGTSIVDQDKCIGCGLCTTKCKFDAISIETHIEQLTFQKNLFKNHPFMRK